VTFRCWLRDEFDGADEDERADQAWVARYRWHGDRFLHRDCDDVETAAQWFADHCHSRRDGWEWTWPIEVVVHDGDRYFVVSVDRDMEPVFYSSKPKPIEAG
jgi:hypothetical protein